MDKKEALKKAQRYCVYQERCHSEVRTKLLKLKVYGDDLEEIISSLIQDDFLNEQRFAEVYAGGKMRIKSWGKQKIINKLRAKRVSAYSIKKAIESLDEVHYAEILEKLLEKKYSQLSVREDESYIIRKKLFNFAFMRGFEQVLINKKIEKWFK